MNITTHSSMTAIAVLVLVAIGCGSVPPSVGSGESGRLNKQAGEYAKEHGFDIPAVELGTETFQLRQTHAAGRQERIGHSSDYLPIYRGPLAREKDDSIARLALDLIDKCDIFRDAITQAARANMPTSKKFDSAVEVLTGQNPNYTDYYLSHHYNPDAPHWTGLCHNWAPAGVLEPIAQLVWSSDRIVGNQPTGIGDFRELVTATLPNLRTYFIGHRNNGDGVEDEDTDLDVADVVAALKYAIQDNDYGIVFDVTSTSEVWNQPVDHYTQSVTDGSGDAAVAGLIPSGGTAKKIRLTVPYTVEASYAHRGDTRSRTLRLDGYLIEDAGGKVVDSKWITPPKEHPDFMWVPIGLFQSTSFQMLTALYHQGTRMEDVAAAAELCDEIALFAETLRQGGVPSQAARDAVRQSLAMASQVIDSQKLDRLITTTAANVNVDLNQLRAAVTGS